MRDPFIQRATLTAGLDPALYAGHSLRAGFCTQAYLNGAPELAHHAPDPPQVSRYRVEIHPEDAETGRCCWSGSPAGPALGTGGIDVAHVNETDEELVLRAIGRCSGITRQRASGCSSFRRTVVARSRPDGRRERRRDAPLFRSSATLQTSDPRGSTRVLRTRFSP